jgi:hypothetical protein
MSARGYQSRGSLFRKYFPVLQSRRCLDFRSSTEEALTGQSARATGTFLFLTQIALAWNLGMDEDEEIPNCTVHRKPMGPRHFTASLPFQAIINRTYTALRSLEFSTPADV